MEQTAIELGRIIWKYHQCKVETKHCDLILGLGSYDLRVAERCAELYHEKVAPKILFTGALGNWTKEMWKCSEAEMFRDEAIRFGVPSSDITMEQNATNLGENIIFSRRLLKHHTLKRILLVTKPNTLRRAYATAKKMWPEIEFFTDCPAIDLKNQSTPNRTLSDIINEMVGDISRILIYPKMGFQIHQEIPEEVIKAFQELKEMGYTKHLPKQARA